MSSNGFHPSPKPDPVAPPGNLRDRPPPPPPLATPPSSPTFFQCHSRVNPPPPRAEILLFGTLSPRPQPPSRQGKPEPNIDDCAAMPPARPNKKQPLWRPPKASQRPARTHVEASPALSKHHSNVKAPKCRSFDSWSPPTSGLCTPPPIHSRSSLLAIPEAAIKQSSLRP